MTDGFMSKHVIVPASGTAKFPNPQAMAAPQNVSEEDFYFDLVEPDAMKNRLNEVSMDNWIHCVDEALRKSGTKPDGTPDYKVADLSLAEEVAMQRHYLGIEAVRFPERLRTEFDIPAELAFYQAAFPHWRVRDSGTSEWSGKSRKWLHFGDDNQYLTFNDNGVGV